MQLASLYRPKAQVRIEELHYTLLLSAPIAVCDLIKHYFGYSQRCLLLPLCNVSRNGSTLLAGVFTVTLFD